VFPHGPRRQEQCPEVWRLAADGARGVHSVDLCGKCEPGETTVEAVLSVPGGALVIESKTVSTPGMSDDVMDGAKPVERTAELAVEKRMKALAGGGGRGDLECPNGAYGKDELFVAFVGLGTLGERHPNRLVTDASSKESEEVIRFPL